MVDIHTHILHNLDDGPKTVDDSICVIRALVDDGVTDIVATSHYFSSSTAMEEFAERSRKRIDELKEVIAEKKIGVNVILGAEVHIDSLLLNNQTLKPLCFENTDNILLEIPPAFYKDEAFELIDKIVSYNRLKPIIAHVERYNYLKNEKALTLLRQMGCIIQVDAQCLFQCLKNRCFCIKMIKAGLIDVIASDCHDIKIRMPNLSKAYEIIEKKLGKETVEKLKNNARNLIGK